MRELREKKPSLGIPKNWFLDNYQRRPSPARDYSWGATWRFDVGQFDEVRARAPDGERCSYLEKVVFEVFDEI